MTYTRSLPCSSFWNWLALLKKALLHIRWLFNMLEFFHFFPPQTVVNLHMSAHWGGTLLDCSKCYPSFRIYLNDTHKTEDTNTITRLDSGQQRRQRSTPVTEIIRTFIIPLGWFFLRNGPSWGLCRDGRSQAKLEWQFVLGSTFVSPRLLDGTACFNVHEAHLFHVTLTVYSWDLQRKGQINVQVWLIWLDWK